MVVIKAAYVTLSFSTIEKAKKTGLYEISEPRKLNSPKIQSSVYNLGRISAHLR